MNRLNFLNRIKEVIKYYSLTSSTFAESISVPKSSISHLMSGRNKPSLDFVLKIIDKFPEVDLYWLLNGEGSFPKNNIIEETIPEIEHTDITDPVKKEEIQPQKVQDTPTLFSGSTANNNVETDKEDYIQSKKTKKLVKVILLYNDGSFDEFNK
ncbi:DNA-binding transcriptional regulator, XRE-family HTH domain [Tenacibaculum sp. MAR_2009_124]|uniref:helix-turn-helix domain-containing protein n=1 Tax=Tenacibaculum sp. MAR_2009_124 TaxID=1250059 RepID=UPI00089BAA22|nr:helix-turn-helix transcriptional regulator [Tenacibaculum sp. MAR_2009_124]SEB47975.1 DNA-binding transcriptional regulator, XRE-family HTH domain [Tenacibaculum sp. MAR_2009_124]